MHKTHDSAPRLTMIYNSAKSIYIFTAILRFQLPVIAQVVFFPLTHKYVWFAKYRKKFSAYVYSANVQIMSRKIKKYLYRIHRS